MSAQADLSTVESTYSNLLQSISVTQAIFETESTSSSSSSSGSSSTGENNNNNIGENNCIGDIDNDHISGNYHHFVVLSFNSFVILFFIPHDRFFQSFS